MWSADLLEKINLHHLIGKLKSQRASLAHLENTRFIKQLTSDLLQAEATMSQVHDIVENLISACRTLKNQNAQLQSQLDAQASNVLTADDQTALTDGQSFLNSLAAPTPVPVPEPAPVPAPAP